MPREGRWIIHLDLDAFYASVEILDDPSLKGLPVIVGGLGPRSVVSTCSYEARARKVRSGMPTARARALCPEGVFLRGRMSRYQELSRKVMAIFRRYTPLVEPLSLDEAFLDVTGSIALFGPAVKLAERIRAEVLAETGLTVSAGVASSKHVAKIASGMNKPDALTLIPPGTERDFLRTLDIGELWGVGRVTAERLRSMGLATAGDVADLPRGALAARLGETGRRIWELANGMDDREVEPDRPAKSLAAEETYPVDIEGSERISRELLGLSVRVAERMRAKGLGAMTVTLKARDHAFVTRTRSRTAQSPFRGDHESLHRACLELFPAGPGGPWRLLGVAVSNLVDLSAAKKPDLLAHLRGAQAGDLGRAIDLARRLGGAGLVPATLLEREGADGAPGSVPGSGPGSAQGSGPGFGQGSAPGSGTGFVPGSAPGSGTGSGPPSLNPKRP